MTTAQHFPRCDLHGFLLGPTGSCLRCRKDQEERLAAQTRSGVGKLFVSAGVLIALLVLFAIGRSIVSAVGDGLRARKENATALASANGGGVLVYTTTTCPACRMAKTWMNAHDVAYVEKNVDTDEIARTELRGLSGGAVAVPTFVVGDEVLAGFDPAGIRLTRAMTKHGLR